VFAPGGKTVGHITKLGTIIADGTKAGVDAPSPPKSGFGYIKCLAEGSGLSINRSRFLTNIIDNMKIGKLGVDFTTIWVARHPSERIRRCHIRYIRIKLRR
jgi:hypothetical protein